MDFRLSKKRYRPAIPTYRRRMALLRSGLSVTPGEPLVDADHQTLVVYG